MQIRSRAQHPPGKRGGLRLEITVALIAKTILLYAIWAAFFSHPTDKHLNGESVQRALLGSAPAATAAREASHHARP